MVAVDASNLSALGSNLGIPNALKDVANTVEVSIDHIRLVLSKALCLWFRARTNLVGTIRIYEMPNFVLGKSSELLLCVRDPLKGDGTEKILR